MTFYNKGPRTQINAFRQLYQHCVRYRGNQTFILTWFCIDSSFHDNGLHQPVQQWHLHQSRSQLYSIVILCTYHRIKELVQLYNIHIQTTANKTNQNLLYFLSIFKRREYILSMLSIQPACRICSTDHHKQAIYPFLQYQLSWILAAENHRRILCGQYLYKSLI